MSGSPDPSFFICSFLKSLQMLVVENRLEGEENIGHRSFNYEEFIWPHGITPPLHHVRKRRFRKRVNKRVCSCAG
jgi:TATA-binding protein-associated factor Taf7